MRSIFKFFKPAMGLFIYGLLLVGCSHFQSKECEPDEVEAAPCTEEHLNICVKIVDKRWCKDGGYGMPKVSIYLKKDLALLVKEPMIEAFAENNLDDADCGVGVEIEIEQFFCDVVEHRCSWNCVSEIIFNAKVVGCDGKAYYSRRISGLAENDFEMSEKSGKARKALETALEDAMCNLLEDKSFRRAIKKASVLGSSYCSYQIE